MAHKLKIVMGIRVHIAQSDSRRLITAPQIKNENSVEVLTSKKESNDVGLVGLAKIWPVKAPP